MAAKTTAKTTAAAPAKPKAKAAAKTTATTKSKPMSAKAYAAYLKYVNQASRRKTRGWSPDDTLPVCSARAVAESLRLALGVAVTDEDVLTLHAAASCCPERPASLLSALEAAQGYGIGGWFPADYRPATGLGLERSVLLGLDMAVPHAVTVGSDGTWWSWGEPRAPADFPGAVIGEAWQVTWA